MRDIYTYEFDMLTEESVYDFFSEGTVYGDKKENGNKKTKDKLYIAIYPDDGRNFYQDPYFKVSWQSNFGDNDKIARIKMKSNYYDPHYMKTVEITNDIAKNINVAMASPCKDDNRVKQIKKVIEDELKDDKNLSEAKKKELMEKDITVWDSALYDIYEIENEKIKYTDLQKDIPYRKYKNITFEPKGNEKLKKPTMRKWGKDK